MLSMSQPLRRRWALRTKFIFPICMVHHVPWVLFWPSAVGLLVGWLGGWMGCTARTAAAPAKPHQHWQFTAHGSVAAFPIMREQQSNTTAANLQHSSAQHPEIIHAQSFRMHASTYRLRFKMFKKVAPLSRVAHETHLSFFNPASSLSFIPGES